MENKIYKITFGLMIVVLLVAAFNTYEMSRLKNANKNIDTITSNAVSLGNQKLNKTKPNLMTDVVPKGVPTIYGKELGVSYDDVSYNDQKKADLTIKKLGTLDTQISLSGKNMERYIAVASQISCEYCCGTEAIIDSNGKAACGCEHSFAMRGLAKYLIKNHGNEYTNDGILEELGKWKTLFFPGPIAKKALVLKEKGIELNYINLASNKYRGIENGN